MPYPTSRALRRHERARMIARAERAVVCQDMGDDFRKRWALCNHDHLKNCSFWMCGNPRRWDGEPTVQERRWAGEDERTIRGELEKDR